MALTQSGLRAQRAIVTEPSGLRVVVGCKGTVPLRIVVHGRAAHGCRPWLGLNAVEKAMLVAQKVLEMDLPEVELPDLGTIKATLNLGLVQGGVAYNIVPDCCELWFDRRTVPGEVPEAVVSEIRAVVDEIVAREPDLQAEVAVARPDWDWEPIAQRGLRATLVPPESDMPNWLAAHHERVHGHAPEWCFTDGYNEMDFLINDMGIPAVQYGPGDSHLCHTNEERLAISDLIMCTQVYSGLIEDAACREKMEMR
jgi:acetylornithine deacetylase/succinyl-diaminopimelate desuccinylase-like protein